VVLEKEDHVLTFKSNSLIFSPMAVIVMLQPKTVKSL